jgi:heme/copper-type cytochrome/quinol oxidase subunit 2
MSQPGKQFTEPTEQPSARAYTSPLYSAAQLSKRHEYEGHLYGNRSGIWNFLLWFLLAAIIIYGLIAFFNPAFAQQTNKTTGQPNGTLNQTTAIVTAIIGGLIVVFIIYLFRESYKY